MNTLLRKKLFFASVLCVEIFSLAAVAFLLTTPPPPRVDSSNQLAQIVAIENQLLHAWGQSGSLKNNLAYNSAGADVVLLQRMLSQDPTIYPEKKVTGYYGDSTFAAVKKFQREYGFAQTGSVDGQTRQKLNEIFLSYLCPEPVAVYPDFFIKKITVDSPLPADYAPGSLRDVSKDVKTLGIACVRSDVLPHIAQMFAEAKRDGVDLMITSGYRKPDIQKYLYDFWIQTEGDRAINEIAKPGLSEHQLGTAIDLTDSSISFAGVDDRFATSKGGAWMQANAYKYGFIMSFPEGKREVTGFTYEPWHWRFVGVDAATALRQQRLTYNEAHFDPNVLPLLRESVDGLALSTPSFLSVFVDGAGNEKILIENNKNRELPIASITKLMVALVASERYSREDVISVSGRSLGSKGLSGIYKAGDQLLFSDALHALLIASHNEIASAIAEHSGTDQFRLAMNEKAKVIGASHTNFVNVTGLDPTAGSEEINHSTVFDLYKLARYIWEHHPDIFSITTQKNFSVSDASGNFIADIHTTDKLLSEQNLPFSILGGKTGETPRAKQNLVIVSDSPCGGKIFSALLGSPNSFADMQKLLWYVRNSYNWSCSP